MGISPACAHVAMYQQLGSTPAEVADQLQARLLQWLDELPLQLRPTGNLSPDLLGLLDHEAMCRFMSIAGPVS